MELENPLDILHQVIGYLHEKKHEFYKVLMMQKELIERANDPQWDLEVPADVSLQPYVVNYKNRKHIFIYNPQTFTINLSDNAGEFTAQLLPNVWTQLDFPNGTRLLAVSGSAGTIVASGVILKVQCVDEPILFSGETIATAGYATLSNVASSITTVTLSPANKWRKGWSVFNDSTSVLFITFGPNASNANYTVQVASQGFYEMPTALWGGLITGIWTTAAGAARVTELT